MKRTAWNALLAGGAVFASAAAPLGDARAETTYTLSKVTITGSKTVPVEKLYAVVQEKKGSTVTQSDIIADRDAIMKVLEQANVAGAVKVSIATMPTTKRSTVTFAVEDQGTQAPVVTHVAPKLHQEIFAGNKALPTDKLMEAVGWTPGIELSNEKLSAGQQAILAAYKAAKLPVNVSVAGGTQALGNGTVDVTWTITETKAKKKRDTEDQGTKTE